MVLGGIVLSFSKDTRKVDEEKDGPIRTVTELPEGTDVTLDIHHSFEIANKYNDGPDDSVPGYN